MSPALASLDGIPTYRRGVHLLPFRNAKGSLVAVAIDGHGREVARAALGRDAMAANDKLWDTLYAKDPR